MRMKKNKDQALKRWNEKKRVSITFRMEEGKGDYP